MTNRRCCICLATSKLHFLWKTNLKLSENTKYFNKTEGTDSGYRIKSNQYFHIVYFIVSQYTDEILYYF